MTKRTLIPNTFQHPNLYIDHLAYLLTAEEQAVLQKAVREILGWQDDRAFKRQAHIALSVFVKGKFSKKDGSRLCYGCGLGLQTVRKALSALHEFGILLKTGKATQSGQLYTLQIDADKIDWEGLKARHEARGLLNKAKTSAATEASLRQRGLTSDVTPNVGRNAGGNVGRNAGGNVGRKQRNPEETQLETQIDSDSEISDPSETTEDRLTRLQEKFGADPLETMAIAADQAKSNSRPPGWRSADPMAWEICQLVAEQFPCKLPIVKPSHNANTKEMVRRNIDKWSGGATLLLEAFGGDAQATKDAITAFRLEYDGGFTVAGPQSLVNALPSFVARKDKPKKRRGGRRVGTWTEEDLRQQRQHAALFPPFTVLYGLEKNEEYFDLSEEECQSRLADARDRLVAWAREETGWVAEAIGAAGGAEAVAELVMEREGRDVV